MTRASPKFARPKIRPSNAGRANVIRRRGVSRHGADKPKAATPALRRRNPPGAPGVTQPLIAVAASGARCFPAPPPSCVASPAARLPPHAEGMETTIMNQIVYIVGAVVIVMAVLAFFGMR